MTLSQEIVRQWRTLTSGTMPETALAAGRLHLLDAIGVGIAASSLPQGEPYRRFSGSRAGPISLLNGQAVSDPAEAALINGGLIHSLEFDDTHTASIVHGSAVLASTVLAMAQAHPCSPEAALRAYIAGYEIFIRIGLAAAGGFQANGFQVTSVAGTLVSALIAADMAGGTDEQKTHAIGIALSQASGVFEFLSNGSSVKSMHPGWAAHSGIIAARMAMAGLTGPLTAIEGSRGLFAAFARDQEAAGRLSHLLADCGTKWHVEDVAFKFLPCCHYLHPFAEGAGQLRSQIDDLSQIEDITLMIAERAAPIVCEPWAIKLAPADGHSARWSLPVVVAMQLNDGRIDLDSFDAPISPEVLALARKCRWEPLSPNQFPDAFEARLLCRLTDGRTLDSFIPDVFGNKGRPATRADVLGKFRANAGRALTWPSTDALERFILDPVAPDFRDLADALRDRTQQEGQI
jgi:2-methylcitrate dehydratase PrpD